MASRVILDINEPQYQYNGPLMLASGHRPFFLCAGLYATLGLALWVAAYEGLLSLDPSWHGHEMLFGFATAAIGGFLMAAVPKWTSFTMPRKLRSLCRTPRFRLPGPAKKISLTITIAPLRWHACAGLCVTEPPF